MRKNKKTAIMDIAALKYDINYVNFLRELLNLSNDGIVYNFILRHQEEIVNSVFHGDTREFMNCYIKLVKDKFLEAKGTNLIILPWQDHVLYAMKYNIEQSNKRIYRKDTAADQVKFTDYAVDTFGNTKKVVYMKWNINWDKIKGIRIPRTFKDLLSGQDESFIYSKEKIRYLLGLITLADTDGVIQAFNVQYVHGRLSEIFEENTLALSTCYDVHKKLLNEEIISVYDTPSGYQNLRIQGYKDGFKKGYIAAPFFIFQEVFKKLETAAIKIFFDVIFKFNNGDNGKGNVDANKPVIFKVALNSTDSDSKIIGHVKVLGRLKKRCRSEILKLFSGTRNISGLNTIFNIDLHKINRGLLFIRMKREYFIKKGEAVKASFFNTSIRFEKKADIIKKALSNTLIKLNNNEFNRIIEVFLNTNKRAIKAIINIVNRQIQDGIEIENIIAYIKTVQEQYIFGKRVLLPN